MARTAAVCVLACMHAVPLISDACAHAANHMVHHQPTSLGLVIGAHAS